MTPLAEKVFELFGKPELAAERLSKEPGANHRGGVVAKPSHEQCREVVEGGGRGGG